MGGSPDPARVVSKYGTHALHDLSKLGKILSLETRVCQSLEPALF